jgi:hypothetical protein
MYHSVIAMMFRPFLNTKCKHHQLRSFSSTDASPKAVYDASINQLKKLLYVYYVSGVDAKTHLWLNAGQITLCVALLEDLSDPLWRHYFLLCLRYWRNFYYLYPIFHGEVKAFLSMAMEKDAITAREAQHLRIFVEKNGEHHETPVEPFTSILFDPSGPEIRDVQLRTMASKFEDLVLFDNYTNVNVERPLALQFEFIDEGEPEEKMKMMQGQ